MTSQSAALPSAILLSLHPDLRPPEFILQHDVCTIGRSAMCDIVVANQKTVSRLHAKIELEGPRYLLHDANSANGTFVNGKCITGPHLLQEDDVIGLGSPTPLLRFSDPDPTTKVQTLLQYNSRTMAFLVNGKPLDLTPQEFYLLHHLYRHVGDVCTREGCARAIWKRDYDPGPDDDNLDRTISNIRRKLRHSDPTIDPAEIIKTRRGLGYELSL